MRKGITGAPKPQKLCGFGARRAGLTPPRLPLPAVIVTVCLMILRYICLALFSFVAAQASAQACGGSDLRPTLSDAERAELEARVAATPYATGNHWRATRADQIIHLIGTVHLSDARLASRMERLAPLIAEADLLLVEATAEEEAKLQDAISTRPELLFITEGPTLPSLMPDAEWQALAQAMTARGIPAFMAAKFQPWYLSIMLSMPGCAIAQMGAGVTGLDHTIMQAAREASVPQRALEPYDTLFSLMGQEPIEEQIRYLTLGILPEQVAEDGLATLMESYFEEQVAQVLEVNRLITRRHVDLPGGELDALMDEMLDLLLFQRNRDWIPHLLAAPDGLTIAAFGAAHLPGAAGVPALLEAEGFTLERLPF